jgi:prepilin-type N-terminal cleavage/methylation domain-containing protein
MKTFTRHTRQGFTLVELLVASAIMIVLVLIVTKVAVDTLTAYDKVVADLSTQAEARSVLDSMERDLNTAVFRPDGRCWMEVIAPQATGDASGLLKLANISSDLQPVLMFFASPNDRTRWSTSGGVRTAISGETCAVSYRMGRRSPFDNPGATIQQVYCVQRTVIDAQNTFNQAIPILTVPTAALSTVTTGTPFTYWYNASRSYISPYGAATAGTLISSTQMASGGALDAANTNTGWTMDEQNFCAQNIVAMNLTFWCASSENSAADVARGAARTLSLPAAALRPVVCYPGAAADETLRRAFGAAAQGSGYRGNYYGPMSSVAPGIKGTDYFNYRARFYSDRVQLDVLADPLPYSLRQVEVSVTVLSPAGARELRGIQANKGVAVGENTNTSEFRRIVALYGRPYSRRVIVLGNGN